MQPAATRAAGIKTIDVQISVFLLDTILNFVSCVILLLDGHPLSTDAGEGSIAPVGATFMPAGPGELASL